MIAAWLAVVTPTSSEPGKPSNRQAHPRMHTFLATSDIHLHHKLKISRRECLEQARDAVAFAKSLYED